MAVQTTYPGVYVREVGSGVHPIVGVSTSTTIFLGQAIWGPIGEPVLCLSYSDFDRTFTSMNTISDLARSVRLFFLNGGTKCYVMRLGRNDAVRATFTFNDGANPTLIVNARNGGALGNTIDVQITPNADPALFNLRLRRMEVNSAGVPVERDVESWANLSMNPLNPRFAPNYVNYRWVELRNVAGTTTPPVPIPTQSLASGTDGTDVDQTDYRAAYPVLDREIDIFNLMVLPNNNTAFVHNLVWGEASDFCLQRRAFLLMDPENNWQTAQDASTGVAGLRAGLVNDHSAVFFPRLRLNEPTGPINIGPSGAMAGLIARIDANRGVWKAPAGVEASLRGINGVERRFSDGENGVLNPQAVNTIRVFESGIVNWGARTMDGDDDFASEYKYIPVRRTALFIEESLFRGLKWVVFEPNDEPLWAQIRLNVGAFMHNLFRQGAFQGKTKDEAYFVKCDKESTTQNDIDLGIVNILVGFAPLKPAEFVVLTLQQMAGQIQV